MTTTLITGANKGLGRETARRLVDAGHDVWLGARDPQAGEEAAAAVGGRFVRLDVTDQAGVDAARDVIAAAGGLDVLVHNAAIAAGRLSTLDTDIATLSALFDTNVVGVARVTLAFLPLLEQSANPRIVNVSSSLGSLGRTVEPGSHQHAYDGLDYPATKAALNMVTLKLAHALPAFRVNAVAPGYTATALNDFSGPQTVEEGAEAIVRAALLGPDGPTGAFLDRAGEVVAW
jgi:NAD(P)-dependent dehydrogenase (short-subunit alcohol dehydrogenase family)